LHKSFKNFLHAPDEIGKSQIMCCFSVFTVDFLNFVRYNDGTFVERSHFSAMLNVVLVEPEIPQNCGNIARTCAATGARLHLVKPLGFDVSDRAVRRAGLDYWHLVEVTVYENLDELFARHPEAAEDCWLATTKAPQSYAKAAFRDGCWLFFGKETAGLPEAFRLAHYERCIRLPIRAQARSLNLSNSVAVLVFEALRQMDFPGLPDTGEMADPVRISHFFKEDTI